MKSEQLFGGIYPFDEHMFALTDSLHGNQREESEMKSNPIPHNRLQPTNVCAVLVEGTIAAAVMVAMVVVAMF